MASATTLTASPTSTTPVHFRFNQEFEEPQSLRKVTSETENKTDEVALRVIKKDPPLSIKRISSVACITAGAGFILTGFIASLPWVVVAGIVSAIVGVILLRSIKQHVIIPQQSPVTSRRVSDADLSPSTQTETITPISTSTPTSPKAVPESIPGSPKTSTIATVTTTATSINPKVVVATEAPVSLLPTTTTTVTTTTSTIPESETQPITDITVVLPEATEAPTSAPTTLITLTADTQTSANSGSDSPLATLARLC